MVQLSGNTELLEFVGCGSGYAEIISTDEKGNKTWKCEDCGYSWNEYRYEHKQDDSAFVTSDLKDGSQVIH